MPSVWRQSFSEVKQKLGTVKPMRLNNENWQGRLQGLQGSDMGEMAPSVKELPYKNGELCSVPLSYVKIIAEVYNSSIGEAKTHGTPELAGRPAGTNGWAPSSTMNHVSKSKVESNWRKCPVPISSLHVLCINMHTQAWTHAHIANIKINKYKLKGTITSSTGAVTWVLLDPSICCHVLKAKPLVRELYGRSIAHANLT